MNNEILILVITNIISPLAAGFGSWFFTKKKYNVEVDSSKIENLAKIIEVQATLIKSLQESGNLYMDRNKQLELEVVELRKQMFNLMSSICLDFTCKHRQTDDAKTKRSKDKINDPRYSD